MTLTMNQLGVINNYHQHPENYKRVVTLCSAGCLRSPTAAVVLASDPFNFNTRSAGLTEEYAIIPFTDSLIEWADEIVVMEEWMEDAVRAKFPDYNYTKKPIIVLNILDQFAYRDSELMAMVKQNYLERTKQEDT